MAALMERPAPSIAEVAPVALDCARQRYLEKELENRWQSARNLKAALAWIASPCTDSFGAPRAGRSAAPYHVLGDWGGAIALFPAIGYSAGTVPNSRAFAALVQAERPQSPHSSRPTAGPSRSQWLFFVKAFP